MIMETTNRLQELYYIARDHAMVHSKGDFATLIRRDPSTFSHLWKNDGKANFDDAVTAAELALLKAGIAIDSPDTISPTNPTDAASTKNALPGSVAELQSIIRQQAEMIHQQQEQINRLNREIDGLYERIDELKRATSIAAQSSVQVG